MLYEKTLKKSRIDKKIDGKEVGEVKKIYNRYIDKRSEIMGNTQLKVEAGSRDVISRDSISPEQKSKLKKFFAKIW